MTDPAAQREQVAREVYKLGGEYMSPFDELATEDKEDSYKVADFILQREAGLREQLDLVKFNNVELLKQAEEHHAKLAAAEQERDEWKRSYEAVWQHNGGSARQEME